MKRTAREIAAAIGGELHGDGETVLHSVASLKNAQPADLTYAEEKFHDQVPASRAGCVIVASGEFPGITVITVANPKLAFARAAALLLVDDDRQAGIHPSAVIAGNVTLGTNVRIGPCAVVESGVAIGDNSTLEAGCVVGRGSQIGADCTLYPRVVIYHDVAIGNRVIVHAGAVIGADGFGFVRQGREYVKFPQAGRVVIEDDVEIGANTCIDRGSLETTVVRRGVKLDNLVQIAHNVEIGEHTVIAAQTGISGSCTIGPDSLIGGQVGMGEQANLERGTIIGGQGGVLKGKRVKGGEVLFGTPVRPLKEFLHEQAALSRLPRLVEEVRKLRREWGELRRRQSPGT